MQTFRDCERQVNLDLTTGDCASHSCANPLIYADMLCGPIASTDTPMIPGASRAMMYGGGYLKYRYDLAVVQSTNMPCTFDVKAVTAIAKLPLLEDDLTPAYLPNLAIARSQLSVVHATQSDNDEDILWWDDAQLLAYNTECLGTGGTNCQGVLTGCSDAETGHLRRNIWENVAAAMYGRVERTHRIKVKRRLREREALFLLTQFVYLVPGDACDSQEDWGVRRTVYHRYAVRVAR